MWTSPRGWRMIELQGSRFTDIMPENLASQLETQAFAYALGRQIEKLCAYADGVHIYAAVASIPEKILDVLTVELRTPAYNQKFSIEVKRALIEGTLTFYARMGTPAACNQIIEIIFGSGYIEYEFVERYCADVAERKYQENLRAKGPDVKLGKDFAFVEYIEDQIINKRRSPGAALAQIQIDGKKFDTEICETTLYNWIYRGDIFLNLTEADLLYKGERRNEGRKAGDNNRARPAKGDTIEQRPEEINRRETFGNWEMDSVMGCKGSKAALVVLTERLTRYPVIVRVPDHTMESVVRALDRMERRMGAKFREVFHSITVDNGCEFQDCEGMERSKRARKPRTKIFYCHPYSAYERGSNENMNRIIRRFFPKGTNFDNVSAAEVAEVEEWLANYPRRILGWKTPQMLYDEYMTVAA